MTKRNVGANGLCQLLTSLLLSLRGQTGQQVNRHPLHPSRRPHGGLGCQPTTEDCLQLPLPGHGVGRNNHWAFLAVLLQRLKQNGKTSDGKETVFYKEGRGGGRRGGGQG